MLREVTGRDWDFGGKDTRGFEEVEEGSYCRVEGFGKECWLVGLELGRVAGGGGVLVEGSVGGLL